MLNERLRIYKVPSFSDSRSTSSCRSLQYFILLSQVFPCHFDHLGIPAKVLVKIGPSGGEVLPRLSKREILCKQSLSIRFAFLDRSPSFSLSLLNLLFESRPAFPPICRCDDWLFGAVCGLAGPSLWLSAPARRRVD